MYLVYVPKQLCPETVLSRSGYVPKRPCPETVMSRNSYVPKWLCPETVMSRSGYVLKRLCPEVAMSRNGYVPKWQCPETVMSRSDRHSVKVLVIQVQVVDKTNGDSSHSQWQCHCHSASAVAAWPYAFGFCLCWNTGYRSTVTSFTAPSRLVAPTRLLVHWSREVKVVPVRRGDFDRFWQFLANYSRCRNAIFLNTCSIEQLTILAHHVKILRSLLGWKYFILFFKDRTSLTSAAGVTLIGQYKHTNYESNHWDGVRLTNLPCFKNLSVTHNNN